MPRETGSSHCLPWKPIPSPGRCITNLSFISNADSVFQLHRQTSSHICQQDLISPGKHKPLCFCFAFACNLLYFHLKSWISITTYIFSSRLQKITKPFNFLWRKQCQLWELFLPTVAMWLLRRRNCCEVSYSMQAFRLTYTAKTQKFTK